MLAIHVGGNVTVQGNHVVEGDSITKGSHVVEKDLVVRGDSNFEGSVLVQKDMAVAGDMVVGGTLATDTLIVGGKDMSREINRLDNRIDKTGAQAAALAGLRPVDTDADQLWSMSASVGNYKGETAGAVGVFYRPTDKVLVGVGGTIGDSDNMMNASVSFALNKGKNVGMGKVAMAKEMNALKQENAQMKQVMMAMAKKLDSLSLISNKQAGFPDLPNDHWANKAVSTLHGNGFVKGYPDGTFKGDQQMTRYEYAEMLYNALARGIEVDLNHVKEYAPELQQIAQKENKPDILQNIGLEAPQEYVYIAEEPVERNDDSDFVTGVDSEN